MQPISNSSFAFSLASFVAGLLQPAPRGAPASADGRKRGGLPLLQVGLHAGSLAALTQASNGVPKGYLRVLVFNTDSVLVDQRTVQLSQAALNNYEVLRVDTLAIRQAGYVSVYVGNESAVDVLFDDVQVEYQQGLLVQETQYDPAGLELAGLAAPSPGIRGLNNYRFNGKEFQADLGLAWNHQDWRFYSDANSFVASSTNENIRFVALARLNAMLSATNAPAVVLAQPLRAGPARAAAAAQWSRRPPAAALLAAAKRAKPG